jgi:hypothetical protein
MPVCRIFCNVGERATRASPQTTNVASAAHPSGRNTMNSKLMKASLAGVAAIAVAAGGSTFAAWSDFQVWNNNASGAGTLTLSTTTPGNQVFNVGNLTPGQVYEKESYLLSNKGSSTPNGHISLSLLNLVGHEGGCGTGNQVVVDDSDCATDTVGEFPQDAKVFIKTKSSDQTTCGVVPANDPNPTGSEKAIVGALDINGTSPASQVSLQQLAVMGPVQLARFGTASPTFDPTLFKPGEGICVDVFVYLPKTVNNEVQGDSATFDLRADLTQAF